MSKLVWKYRSYPGPTAAHLWGPNDANSLCGKMKRSVGTWKATNRPEGRCTLCQRRQARSEEMLQKMLGGEQESGSVQQERDELRQILEAIAPNLHTSTSMKNNENRAWFVFVDNYYVPVPRAIVDLYRKHFPKER